MKKSIATLAVLGIFGVFCLIPMAASASDYSQEQILKELQYLKQKVKSQQDHIDRLESIIDASINEKVDAKVEEKMASAEGSKIKLDNAFIDQLKIKGDLRVRFERRDRQEPSTSTSDDKARDRLRTRFRIGAVWTNKAENWEIGAGLATGGSGGTSTNDTWGESSPFETGDIRLDYAYAKHKMDNFSFTLGQHKNPFVTSWLMWDGDLRFTGLTTQYKCDSGLFATVGGYGLVLYDDDNTAMMYAGQVGYSNKVGDVNLTVAAGYQQYDSVFSTAEAPNPDYDFQIGDVIALAEIPLDKVKISPYAHIWSNFGADGLAGEGQRGSDLVPEDEDLGWVAGVDAKFGAVKVGYAYAVVGADCIYGGLKDADFGTGVSDTDVKGHKIGISYGFTKNFSAGLTAMMYEAAERDNQREADLYQFDVKYKF